MQNKGAWSKYIISAVNLEFAHRGHIAFTVKITIRNSKGNLTVLKREGYLHCHYRLILSEALGEQHSGS